MGDSNEQLKEVKDFGDELEKGMGSFGVVYSAKHRCFLLFGGFKGKGLGRSDAIWRYVIESNEWSQLETTMPDKMQSFGCVITGDCEYVLILGGSDSQGLSEKIHVLELEGMRWRESQIGCPFKGVGHGNVVLTAVENVEYVFVMRGHHALLRAPVSEILSPNP